MWYSAAGHGNTALSEPFTSLGRHNLSPLMARFSFTPSSRCIPCPVRIVLMSSYALPLFDTDACPSAGCETS